MLDKQQCVLMMMLPRVSAHYGKGQDRRDGLIARKDALKRT